jgi:hypothetical protein
MRASELQFVDSVKPPCVRQGGIFTSQYCAMVLGFNGGMVSELLAISVYNDSRLMWIAIGKGSKGTGSPNHQAT